MTATTEARRRADAAPAGADRFPDLPDGDRFPDREDEEDDRRRPLPTPGYPPLRTARAALGRVVRALAGRPGRPRPA